MKVALFPSAYAPAVGGVEELTARLAHRLEEAGEEVEVWTIRHPADLPADEEIDGVRVRRFELPLPKLEARALAHFPGQGRRAWAALAAAARDFGPDVLHVQCFSANGVYADLLSRRTGVPLVVSLQGETVMDDDDIYEHSLTLRLSLRRALRGAAAVTGCSRFVLADAEDRFGLGAGRGTVVPNGVELEGTPAREALDLPFGRFVFAVGRVVEKKGFDLLLNAFAGIAPRHPQLGLVVGGDGPVREELVRAAAAAGLGERVAFPGTLSRAQVAWAMGAAAAFVLPSRVEPFGIVVLEALRAGCPAIVSERGGAVEIVRDGVDGVVTDPLDPDRLATALDRVLSDRELAARLADAGPLRVADFGWASIARRYLKTYEYLAG